MTSGNNDPEEWRKIIGNKHHKDELAKKFKDNNSPMKIARNSFSSVKIMVNSVFWESLDDFTVSICT